MTNGITNSLLIINLNNFPGGGKTTSAIPSKTPSVSVVTNPTNPTTNVASVVAENSSLTGALVGAGVAHSAEVLDMPVDPNEPTYCLCNQVSYGEMIGCDNPDVSILIYIILSLVSLSYSFTFIWSIKRLPCKLQFILDYFL